MYRSSTGNSRHGSPGAAELQDDLGGVGHAVLLEGDARRRIGSDHAEPVVRIGELEPGGHVGDPDGRLQHDPLHDAGVGAIVEEARAEDDGDVVALGEVEHEHRVFDAVLAVGIERDDVAGVGLRLDVVESGLQGGTLAEIDRMSQHACAGGLGRGDRAVGAAVVDAHDVVEVLAELCDDAADDGFFVVQRDHDPGVARVAPRVDLGGTVHQAILAEQDRLGAHMRPPFRHEESPLVNHFEHSRRRVGRRLG